MTEIKPSMLLITSTWQNQETFRLIPIDLGCPFNECIYDPRSKALAIISKTPLQKYVMTEKLDDNGDVEFLKNGKKRPGSGKGHKEERRLIDSYMEYYIEDKSEILGFACMFAVNYNDNEKWITEIINKEDNKDTPPGEVSIANPEQFTKTGPIPTTPTGLHVVRDTPESSETDSNERSQHWDS